MASSTKSGDRPDVNEIILKALKEWEELDFRDLSLWEAFQEEFEDFTDENFKLATITHLRKLRDFQRRRGVWILKQSRTSIAKSLHNTLLEEEATPWTEEEVKRCYDNEKFSSNLIDSLFETDFGRSPRTYGVAFKSTTNNFKRTNSRIAGT